ncbi:hypothetical protein DFA_07519 [Cavenderia fasciculata]|uniref:GB1/RHD3-type G domain-containing protein n=1 Tax=Cavenderia fasciculata TaxID=261658 RepID=F4PWN1_CACFS|nr:uncharacterized protein DFA_07519 [Cavenderia fasciculata]EGG20395.1 hypothetical protein DFA_07519 [Cavenderia fasciculata]|eukprot:XP_004367378.1 hypothetical protein DFA_07519 [Cavenderia fasciculata]
MVTHSKSQPPKSVPLVYPDNYDLVDNELIKTNRPRTKLLINHAALELIKSHCGNQNVTVLSVNGLLRAGKSYLISRMLGSSNAFSIGCSTESVTHGIWIATTFPEHKGKRVILMDCEGLGSVQSGASANHDMSIFLLSCLLSSTFVYNTFNVPTAHDLEQLGVVTSLYKRLKIKEGENIKNPQHLVKHMPHFVWVLRDFHLQPTVNGVDVPIQEYMNHVLAQNNDVGLSDGENMQNNVRQVLLTFFKSFTTMTVATPTSNKDIINRMDTAKESELNADFVVQMAHLVQFLIDGLIEKTGFNGLPIDGTTFTYLVQAYTNAVNDPNNIPTLEGTWESAIKIRIDSTIRDAESFYINEMNAQFAEAPFPMEYEDLLKIHATVITETNKRVNQAVGHLCNDIQLEDIAIRIKRLLCDIEIKKVNGKDQVEIIGGVLYTFKTENEKQSEVQCNRVMKPLGDTFYRDFLHNMSCDFPQVLAALDPLKVVFLKQAIGPAKNAVLAHFVETVLKNEEQFKKLKGYNKDLKEQRERNEKCEAQVRESEQRIKDLSATLENQKKELVETVASLHQKHDENMTKLQKDMEQQRIDADNRIAQAEAAHSTTLATQQAQFKAEMDSVTSKMNTLHSELRARNASRRGGFSISIGPLTIGF